METKKRFRPSLRQYRILEAANKELKLQSAAKDISLIVFKSSMDSLKAYGLRAIRLNWYLLALIVALNICLIWR